MRPGAATVKVTLAAAAGVASMVKVRSLASGKYHEDFHSSLISIKQLHRIGTPFYNEVEIKISHTGSRGIIANNSFRTIHWIPLPITICLEFS